MPFDKIHCSLDSRANGQKHTKNSSIETKSSAVIIAYVPTGDGQARSLFQQEQTQSDQAEQAREPVQSPGETGNG